MNDGGGFTGGTQSVGGFGGGTPGGQMSPATHGFNGIPMKKKVYPNRPTKKLKQSGLKKRLYKSFEKFGSRGKKVT